MLSNESHGLFDGAAQIASAHAVFYGHVTRICLAIDLRRTIAGFDPGKLREGNTFPRWREQPDIFNCFFRIAIRSLVARHKVVSLLPLQHLADRFSSNGGLNRVLNVRDIDTVTRGLLAIDAEI